MSNPSLELCKAILEQLSFAGVLNLTQEDNQLSITGSDLESISDLWAKLKFSFSAQYEHGSLAKLTLTLDSQPKTSVEKIIPTAQVKTMSVTEQAKQMENNIFKLASYLGLQCSRLTRSGYTAEHQYIIVYKKSATTEYDVMIQYLRNNSIPFVQGYEALRQCLEIDPKKLLATFVNPTEKTHVIVAHPLISQCFSGSQ